MITLLPLVLVQSLSVGACSGMASSPRRPADRQEVAGPRAATTEDRASAPQISAYVREILQDRDGVFWFGTNGDGVCRYDGTSLTYLGVAEGLGGQAVREILQAEDGALWFATEGGVSRYESGTFTNYTVAHGLSDDSVWSMMLDRSGTLWVGTHGGVCRFDGTAFVPFPLPRAEVEHPDARFTPLVVWSMFEDEAGHLWFGTDGEGAHRFDGESFTTYTTKDGLAGNQVRSILGDRHGQVWLGAGSGGVSRYDGRAFRTFTAEDGLGEGNVYTMLEDSAGLLWLSTLGAGVCRYDGTSFTSFGVDQGLIVNELPCPCGSGDAYASCHGPGGGHVQEIFEDEDGILWFGCSGGLFRLDGETFVNVTRDGPWPDAPGR